VLLCLLIHKTREAFLSGSWTPFILNTLSQFDMRNTIPELQHEFCTLWNEIVREAWRGGIDCTAVNILREIRHGYIGLHQGTGAFSAHTNFYNPVLAQPMSYQFCNIHSHRIQLGDSPNPSPRSTSLEFQGYPPNADIFIISPKADVAHPAAQKTERTNIKPQLPSSANSMIIQPDHTPRLPRASLPSTPVPVYITLPTADSSIPENIRAVKVDEGTRDLHPLVPIGPPQHSSHSALSAGDTDVDGVYTDDLTPRADSHGSGTGENSQIFIVASPHLTVIDIDPLTGLVPPPSLSVPDPDYVCDASQCPTLAATLPCPPESNQAQDIAAPLAESDTSEISTTVKPMPQSILSGCATLQKSEEVTVIPAPVFPDPQLSPTTTPAGRSCEIPVELPSSVDPACISSDHISHTLGTPSESSMRICSHTFPWPSSVLYSPIMRSNGVLRAHGDTSEMERPIPMVILSDTSQSSTLALDIGPRTPQPDDTSHG